MTCLAWGSPHFFRWLRFGARSLMIPLLLAAVSCGGDLQTAGIEGTGDTAVSAGTVTGFGSVYVNGIRFDTSKAQVEINDNRFAREGDIALGMVVRIEGQLLETAAMGVADKVVYDPLLKGPVTAISDLNSDTKTLTILGQTVTIHSDIAFGGTSFEGLAPADKIEISGFVNANGSLLATRVDAIRGSSQGTAFDVEGRLGNLLDTTFKLQALTVDYTSADFIGGEPADLKDGQWVEVEGNQLTQGVLTATIVRFEERGLAVPPATQVHLEGLIGDFESLSAFTLNGVLVDGEGATIERGSPNQLASGTRVAIEGTAMGDNRLRADRIRLMLPSKIRVAGMIETIDRITGDFSVLGVDFKSDGLTAFEDRSAVADRFIKSRGLAIGDYVEVYGRELNDSYIATRIKRLDGQGSNISLAGPVTNILSEGIFSVLGITVDAQNLPEPPAIEPRDLVRVTGTWTSSSSVVATSVEVLPKR